MIDTHAHLADERLGSLEQVLARARSAGVERVLMAGTDPDEWERQRVIARDHSDVSMAFGLHPWKATGHDVVTNALARLELALDGTPGPVAIGETGLDRSRRHKAGLPHQVASLHGHLRLALERDLPVVLHVVRAHGLMLEILREQPRVPSGVVHSFDGSAEVAKAYESLGLHLSVSGRVCSPQAERLRGSVPLISRDRLLVETDSPDQLPFGADGALNEPANLALVVTRVAELRGETPEQVAFYTAENTRRLFLGGP